MALTTLPCATALACDSLLAFLEDKSIQYYSYHCKTKLYMFIYVIIFYVIISYMFMSKVTPHHKLVLICDNAA
jgi:hypothetical protein